MSDFQDLQNQLKELSQVAPNAEMTDRAIAAARAAINESNTVHQTNPWNLAMHPLRTAIATSAILVSSAIILWLLFSGSSPMVAYAEVVAQLEQVKTIQYFETRIDKSLDGKLNGPTEVTKVTILGRSRQRQEVVSVAGGDPLPNGDTWDLEDFPRPGSVIISDCANGKYVSLNLNEKTYRVIKHFWSAPPDGGKMSATKAAPAPEVDFYTGIREFPVEDAERLPLRKIKGKDTVGFRSTETNKRKHGVDTWVRTVWIDTASNLPVQIDVKIESTDPFQHSSEFRLSDIVFDEPIDERLLSTEPPEGYRVIERQ